MSASDYEQYREGLERQLRADVELLVEAYRAKLRAYETVALARGEIAQADSRPLSFPLGFAPEPRSLPSAAPPAPAAPVPAERPKKAVYYPSEEDVAGALAQVGEEFDKEDFLRALGGKPSRASLYRVLSELVHAGKLEVTSWGSGVLRNRYRKLAAAGSAQEPATGS